MSSSAMEDGISKAVKELVSEVESLALLPAGAARTVACGQPRRHLWDALVALQGTEVLPKCLADTVEAVDSDSDSTAAPSTSSSTSSSHSEAMEFESALADCEALQKCVESLKACHREHDQGHFASTEYAALTVELEKQHRRILNAEQPPQLSSPKLVMIDAPQDTMMPEEHSVHVRLTPSRRLSARWRSRPRCDSRHSESDMCDCDGSCIIGTCEFIEAGHFVEAS
eukprot:gnl/TRDRNA2_/TRDRNA2_86477_c0_seq1.p1 gnl/TRDRNA2_/TRDRNA2_86477_c0~~gnl/TRDRNA2_/TRDRNA2_86477_c0_seq1.p1  ORF type:complete len:227 (-),score=43.17 gnl/TRDRNA2_/TRDRNA2_86477_c0_seq1:182-862(-)